MWQNNLLISIKLQRVMEETEVEKAKEIVSVKAGEWCISVSFSTIYLSDPYCAVSSKTIYYLKLLDLFTKSYFVNLMKLPYKA